MATEFLLQNSDLKSAERLFVQNKNLRGCFMWQKCTMQKIWIKTKKMEDKNWLSFMRCQMECAQHVIYS
jgi:hypothetical protein